MVPEGNFKEFQELTDEGLVSSARERFSTGNILGSQSGRRRSSVETNYIDKNHIRPYLAFCQKMAAHYRGKSKATQTRLSIGCITTKHCSNIGAKRGCKKRPLKKMGTGCHRNHQQW